jgi:CBS domain containing-hemolysin-like protein
MPEVGYELTVGNIYFRIVEVDDKRISKIRIERRTINQENQEEPQ